MSADLDLKAFSEDDFYAAVRRSDSTALAWNYPDLADLLDTERLRDAAVLIGLVQRPTGWHVLLTERAEAMSNHAGQVAFPGGKVDASDTSAMAAAVRELQEEVGIQAEQVRVLGELDRFVTISNYTVTPVLAILSPHIQPTAQEAEVASIFEAPLNLFCNSLAAIESRLWQGKVRSTYAFHYQNKRIWGATAAMLVRLMQRITEHRTNN